MADEFNEDSSTSAPRVVRQKDPTVRAGKLVEIDLSLFFEPQKNETLSYKLEKAPVGLTMDEQTGIVTGISPPNITNQTYPITLVATSSLTGLSSYVLFNLHVKGSGEESAEMQDLLGIAETNLEEISASYIGKAFLQHMINNYFIYIQLQDGFYTGEAKGALLNIRKAETGWSIYIYEHCIVISPADLMFAEGNRGKFLRTLREIYLRDVPQKNWQSIFVLGNDPANVDRAWIIAKEMELPVTDVAPSYIAEVNLATIRNIRQGI